MEDLVLNGLNQFSVNMSSTQMQTERHVAKFKGIKPIGRNGPNFLNRTKVNKLKTETAENTTSAMSSMKMQQERTPSQIYLETK